MFVFGIQHFMYADFVATLVPGWIPFHLFWVYLTAVALIAAAVSICVNLYAQWGCFLLGCMIWVFILTIHIPLLINSHFDAGKITNALKDTGLASCAFILAAFYEREG
jgi:uncharacterized membrane protein